MSKYSRSEYKEKHGHNDHGHNHTPKTQGNEAPKYRESNLTVMTLRGTVQRRQLDDWGSSALQRVDVSAPMLEQQTVVRFTGNGQKRFIIKSIGIRDIDIDSITNRRCIAITINSAATGLWAVNLQSLAGLGRVAFRRETEQWIGSKKETQIMGTQHIVHGIDINMDTQQ